MRHKLLTKVSLNFSSRQEALIQTECDTGKRKKVLHKPGAQVIPDESQPADPMQREDTMPADNGDK